MRRLVRTGPVVWVTLVAMAVTGAVACSKSSSAGKGGSDEPVMVPGPGQEFVTGDVAHFLADDAQSSKPLASPFTLSATERGVGTANIENAVVAGTHSTISWSSGTPLPITGTGGLDLGPVHVDADSTGVTWVLDGGVRMFVVGTYEAGGSVAVGTGGIADPRESVDFRADERTVLTAQGGVTVHVDPQTVELTGPGKISVSGTLKVQTPDSTRQSAAVTFGPGPFKITLTPGGSTGLRINAVLQGKVSAT